MSAGVLGAKDRSKSSRGFETAASAPWRRSCFRQDGGRGRAGRKGKSMSVEEGQARQVSGPGPECGCCREEWEVRAEIPRAEAEEPEVPPYALPCAD